MSHDTYNTDHPFIFLFRFLERKRKKKSLPSINQDLTKKRKKKCFRSETFHDRYMAGYFSPLNISSLKILHDIYKINYLHEFNYHTYNIK